MRGKLYALLLRLFVTPFLVGGILLGFYAGERLHHAGLVELSQKNWVTIFTYLGLSVLGIYLGALFAHATLLFGAVVFFSKAQVEYILSQFPYDGERNSILIKPFEILSNFFWSRLR